MFNESQPWNTHGGQSSGYADIYGAQSSSYQIPLWEQHYDGTQSGSDNFHLEFLPEDWAPYGSYQVPEVEGQYYVSHPPEQGADYVQEPVQVRQEPLEEERNGHDEEDDDYDHDYIREATVSYVTNTVRHRAFDVKYLLYRSNNFYKLTYNRFSDLRAWMR